MASFRGMAQMKNDTLNFKNSFSRNWVPQVPLKTAAQVIDLSRTNREVLQTTNLFDSYGRSVQDIERKTSATGKDLVSLLTYDSVGRVMYTYLPYVSPTATGDAKTDPVTEQGTFYNSIFKGEQFPYLQTIYERSPLSRTQKSLNQGTNWGGSKRGKTVSYETNTLADSVRIWTLNSSDLPVTSQIYSTGELAKTVTTDENGTQVVFYTDREGKTVLSKVQLRSSPGNGHVNWLCTYNVYDDMGSLRVILPPLAIQKINGSWNVSTVSNLITKYKYDARGRNIVKQTPDADSVETVYDVRNRTVFVRDGNLRQQGKWQVVLYDDKDRSTMVGLYVSTATRDSLQSSMNTVTPTQTISYTQPGVADLITSINDNTLYEATNSVTILPGFDTGDNSEELIQINTSLTGGTITVSASNPLPNIGASQLTPLAYTFYDSYDFNGVQAVQVGDFSKLISNGDAGAEPISSVSSNTIGKITGNKVRVLGTNQWLTNSDYYDDKGRLVQIISENISGGSEVVSNLYNFSSKLLSTYLRHTNKHSAVANQTNVLTTMTYEQTGRLLTVTKQINDDGVNKQVALFRYDELGQIACRVLGGGIDSIEYDYNIRGWLKGINKNYAANGTTDGKNHHFGMQLSYDSSYTPVQYNGSLSGVKWRGISDNAYRSYGYNYDMANRLMKADFTQYNGGWNTSAGIDYSMKLGDGMNTSSAYDANGNILALSQTGYKTGGSVNIDNLSYTYVSNSNRLQGIVDQSNDASSTLGDFKEINGNSNNDYTYDANGNLTRDNNKGITAITYNFLNLPETMHFMGKGNIQYTYDAAGRKLRKEVIDSTVVPVKTITTDYIDGYVYRNDTLQFFDHEEGRVRMVYSANKTPTYVFDYYLKDNLGNIRTILTEQSDFSMYTATMETASAAKEAALFSNVEETRTATPIGYPKSDTASKNAFVAKLNAKDGGKKIGPSLILRVMAGDTILIRAKAFYKSQGRENNSAPASAEDMVAAMAKVFGGTSNSDPVHEGLQGASRNDLYNNTYGDVYRRLKEKNPDETYNGKPKAYLNFVLFDDRFKMVDNNSGVRQVKNEPDTVQTLSVDKMAITESGFLYVYTSNETAQDVYFDDVTVAAITGTVLQETHYYPQGLIMEGISSQAYAGIVNNYLYQGQEIQRHEFSDGTGTEWYNFEARDYDPQIGRWHSPDPGNQFPSPYVGMGNYWPNKTDPDGRYLGVDDLISIGIGAVINVAMNWGNISSVGSAFEYFGVGAASGIATLYGGPLAGGAVMGLGNSLVTQVNVTGSIDPGQLISSTAIGVISAGVSSSIGEAIGPAIGSFTAKAIGTATISPVVRTALVNGAVGGITGAGTGAVSSYLNGGDAWAGAIDGLKIGAVTGTVLGAYSGYKDAKLTEHNPWTGRWEGKIDMIPVKRIDQVVSDFSLKSEQTGTLSNKIVTEYYLKMTSEMGSTPSAINNPEIPKAGGFKVNGSTVVGEGNHRAAAAALIYIKTGNDFYLKSIIIDPIYYTPNYNVNVKPFPKIGSPGSK
ncbi:hypothetical protein GO495_13225 [Chitinophaga oryziterrae]|uniref:DUF6443 domain-containing protein n=3 Tax=Chitinophaga oryziterrae TaxID=1031224 RepID=A0A6N8JBA2_9BACT|nr:hypothetical protein [Chitinophaga oryziterrae]